MLLNVQSLVARKPVNPNPGLKFNRIIAFFCVKMFFTAYVLRSLHWDYSNSIKLKDKQCKQKASPKSYKTWSKILANPGIAKSGFEQPGPEARFSKAQESFRASKTIFS